MLRLLGALFLILVGAAIGAQMCGGPGTPPPPSGAQVAHPPPALAEATQAGVPAATAKMPKLEEKLDAAKLQDQQNRTYTWDSGWLRLETIEFSKQATSATITLFIAHGDLFYVDLAGTSLVAGPLNIAAVSTNFPELHDAKSWQSIYLEQLRSSPGPRVPEATPTVYSLDFPPVDRVLLPERVFLKIRFWEPSARSQSNTIVLTAEGSRSMQYGDVASLAWNAVKQESTDEVALSPGPKKGEGN